MWSKLNMYTGGLCTGAALVQFLTGNIVLGVGLSILALGNVVRGVLTNE